MNKEFRFKVIEDLGKSFYQIQLEVAIGHFTNDQKTLGYDVAAENAWLAASAFMQAMERFYSIVQKVPASHAASLEAAGRSPTE